MQRPYCWQSLLSIIPNAQLLTCQVRLGEKETLESTLKFFDDRIERLSELEFYQVRDTSYHLYLCVTASLTLGSIIDICLAPVAS